MYFQHAFYLLLGLLPSGLAAGIDPLEPGFVLEIPNKPPKFEGPDIAWSRPGGLIERPGEIWKDDEIWVYCDKYSYDVGEKVKIQVHTTADVYNIDIVRDGYKPRTVYSKKDLPGVKQKTNDFPYSRGCGWNTTVTLDLDDSWESAFYLIIVRIKEATGRPKEREGFFIVKSKERHASRGEAKGA